MSRPANRAWMTITGSPGTGSLTLNAAATSTNAEAAAGSNYITFATADVKTNQRVTYEIVEAGVGWELGRGLYSSTGPTLTRSEVIITSAGNQTKLSFSSAATVFLTWAHQDLFTVGKFLGIPTALP